MEKKTSDLRIKHDTFIKLIFKLLYDVIINFLFSTTKIFDKPLHTHFCMTIDIHDVLCALTSVFDIFLFNIVVQYLILNIL